MKQHIYIFLIVITVTIGISACNLLERLTGDNQENSASDTAATASDPKEEATKAKTPSEAPAAEAPTEKATAAPETATPSLSIEGVPDLDVSIGPKLSAVDRETSQQLNQQAVKLYRKNDFAAAEPLFLQALKKNPSNLVFRYNLACIASLTNNKERAVALLRQFQAATDCPRCYIMLANATEDADFDNIREEAEFKDVTQGAPEKLTAELKLAKWIEYDSKRMGFPIRVNGLPAISDDGLRIAVVNRFKNGYRMQILLVETGEVSTSAVLLNAKELQQLLNHEVEAKTFRPRIKERIDKAHKKLLGRNWLEFTVKSKSISPTWLRGQARQQFQLGNSTVTYRYPNLTITNSKGRETVNQKLGEFPDDDCTKMVVLSEAYVNGQFHVMLFYQSNISTDDCTPQGGRYHVLTVSEE